MANGLNTERIVQVHKTNTENGKKERKWREITIMTLQQTLLQKFCMKVRCGMQFLMWFFSIYFLLKWSFIACDAVFGGEKWSYAMHKKFLDALEFLEWLRELHFPRILVWFAPGSLWVHNLRNLNFFIYFFRSSFLFSLRSVLILEVQPRASGTHRTLWGRKLTRNSAIFKVAAAQNDGEKILPNALNAIECDP